MHPHKLYFRDISPTSPTLTDSHLSTAIVILSDAPSERLSQGSREVEQGVSSPNHQGPEAGWRDVLACCSQLPFSTLQLLVELRIPG